MESRPVKLDAQLLLHVQAEHTGERHRVLERRCIVYRHRVNFVRHQMQVFLLAKSGICQQSFPGVRSTQGVLRVANDLRLSFWSSVSVQ